MNRYLTSSILSLILVTSPVLAQSEWPTRGWSSTTPSEVGLDAKVLAAFDADISQGKYGYVDSMLVIRNGKVAYERYYERDYGSIYHEEASTPGPLVVRDPTGPYNYFNSWWHPYFQKGKLHTMQSVTKSVVSAVVGIAVGRGEFPDLDTPVIEFFEPGTVANVDERKRRMTIRHLLTMTTGLDWNEDYPYNDPRNTFAIMAVEPDWVQYTMDRPMSVEPGESFQYNSGATLILGHVFNKATGMDLEEYAVRHLFEPLGIDNFHWKRTPFGLTDAQEGLFVSSRDIAKIAYLFLKQGQWEGKQVVPAAWVDASVAPFVSVEDDRSIEYGYKWWLVHYEYEGEDRVAFAGFGFGGQYPIVVPELDLVIVFTGWNILAEGPRLSALKGIERILPAVQDP
jgi:CubicO group peptidase (beta-lactamase class C family)